MSQKTSKKTGTSTWAVRKLPNFHGRRVFVTPGAFYGQIVQLMAECNFRKADSLDAADLVVFSGGADIDPQLYGQKAIAETSFSLARDKKEIEVWEFCYKHKTPMFGICRGAQFLHAMNGGTLWQHVNNHGGCSHYIVDIEEDVRVLATSVHHQMLQVNPNLSVIAVTEENVASIFKDDNIEIDLNKKGSNGHEELEIEAGAYPDTGCFFVQGHPEIGSPEYRSWCMSKLHDFLTEWEGPGLEEIETTLEQLT